MTIDPKNLTAHLRHRAAGNPPSTMPDSAISNCFPGLEFDFRNIWRRMFVGLEMHEADNYVLSGEGELARLAGTRLLLVGGCPTIVPLSGPQRPGKEAVPLNTGSNPDGVWTMEWSNALATVLRSHSGRQVECHFTRHKSPHPAGIPADRGELEAVVLETRPLFDAGPSGRQELAALDPDRVRPGELTQSLCSPWQNDYRECACYYWAASRPDYVNVDVDADGVSVGNSWLAKHRDPKGYVLDDRSDSRLVSYQDLFREWQALLRFVVGGQDHP